MKHTLTALLLITAMPAFAQQGGQALQVPGVDMQQVNPQQMQFLMKNMQQIAACFSKIGPEGMKKLQDQSLVMRQELKQMCKEGRRDDAQQEALAYGEAMAQSPEIQGVRECGESAQKALMAMNTPTSATSADGTPQKPIHICDSLR